MTVLDHLTAAGYSEANAREAVAAGRVQVDGIPVLDPDVSIAEGAYVIERIVWPDAAYTGSNQ